MCGITGIVAFSDNSLPALGRIESATAALEKRGPDASGTFAHEKCRLGHRRLSVIDITDAGAQPFFDATGRYVIVFNGEFFNFKEHRRKLQEQGHAFQSESDTEVLLELFVREGPSCLDKINGFFAFAVYDKQEQSLFLARDRFGVKPLLVYQDEQVLAFASEMKSLMAYGLHKEIDAVAVYEYLHLNYIPNPESIFEKVAKLPPGSWLSVTKGQIVQKQWYRLTDTSHNNPVPAIDKAKNDLRNLLNQSVERRLISDVPLGAFLSGGIDSSVIVALASQHTQHLNTFSIGFKDEPLFDETRYAELVAETFKTNHTTFSLTNDDLFSHLFEVLDYIDEPFADSSALAVYILCKETRKHVTVALSGDGADELFGGYQKHRGEWQMRNGGIAGQLISLLHPVWQSLPQSRNSAFGNLIRKLAKFSEGSTMKANDRYWRWCGYADHQYLNNLVAFKFNLQEFEQRKAHHIRFIKGAKDINDLLISDMHLVLPGDMLTKVDLMSMANSLEVRTPFLDYQVVEYACSMPSDMKLNGQEGKRLLKDTFRDVLPDALFKRPKHGFEVPLLKWFRTELDSIIFDDLLHPTFVKDQGLFQPEAIKMLRKQLHANNPGDVTARLWALLVFQYWWKKWMI